jgi:hypothetical protein
MLHIYQSKSRIDIWDCDGGTDAEAGLLGGLAVFAMKITGVSDAPRFFGASGPIYQPKQRKNNKD